MSQTTLILLAENHAGPDGTTGEHAFAALIENAGRRVLFDTGPCATILANADALGVDLTHLDAVAFSHNHYDHTGALMAVLGRCGAVDVYVRATFFDGSYSSRKQVRYIGPPSSRAEYEAAGARFREVDIVPEWIGEAVLLSGPVPGPDAPTQRGFFTGEPENLIPDGFEHEQFAMVPTPRGWIVLLGCTHRGVENTIHHALHLAEGRPIHAVVGGLHLNRADDDQLQAAATALGRTNCQVLAIAHCTGDASAQRIGELLGRPVTPLHVGWRLSL
jgi:7,8-dihydropterin-6-yl-methyl-4-(beta-D-ribofuranosyl)aminobenzene 5'-phosphate synthase